MDQVSGTVKRTVNISLTLEYHPGSERPEAKEDRPPGRNVLGHYGSLGLGWQVCRFNFLRNGWEAFAPYLGRPDVWVEMPPALNLEVLAHLNLQGKVGV